MGCIQSGGTRLSLCFFVGRHKTYKTQVLAKLACTCFVLSWTVDTGLIPTSPDSRGVTVPSESRGGGRLLDEIHGPESHDVTLEHATRPELHPRKDP